MFSMGEVRRHWEEAFSLGGSRLLQRPLLAPPAPPRVMLSHFSLLLVVPMHPRPGNAKRVQSQGAFIGTPVNTPAPNSGHSGTPGDRLLLLIWRRDRHAPRRRWRICRLPAVETYKRTAERPPTPFFIFIF